MGRLSTVVGGSAPGIGEAVYMPGSVPLVTTTDGREYLLSGGVAAYAAKYAGAVGVNQLLRRFGSIVFNSGAFVNAAGLVSSKFFNDGTRVWAVGVNTGGQNEKAYSTDGGLTWSASSTFGSAGRTAVGDGIAVATGGGGCVCQAYNGTNVTISTWTGTGAVTERSTMGTVSYSPSGFVFNGTDWYINDGTNQTKRTGANPDGAWSATGSMTNGPGNYHHYAVNSSIYVAWNGASGVPKSSTDGITWTDRAYPTGVGIAATSQFYTVTNGAAFGPNSVVWTGTAFIAAVRNRDTGAYRFCRSTNGTTWSLDSADIPMSGAWSTIDPQIATDGAGTVVISYFATPHVFTIVSTDHGVTWKLAPIAFSASAWNGNNFGGSPAGTGTGPMINYSNGRFYFGGSFGSGAVRSVSPTQLAGTGTPDYVGNPTALANLYYRIV